MGRTDDDRPRERVLTLGLISLIGISALNYAAMGMVTVSLPHRVLDLGGDSLAVGLIAGTLFISAVLCRPSIGRFASHLPRRHLILLGLAVNVVCYTLYGQVPDLALLALLRLANGVGEACFYTGSATLVTDLAPPSRRAEAISYYSVSAYLGAGLGPTIGVEFTRDFGLSATFALAGGLCAVAGLMALSLPSPAIAHVPGAKLKWINRSALVPGAVLAFGTTGMIAFWAYVPLYGDDDLHMASVQYVFLVYSAVVISVRLAGKIHQLDPVKVASGATAAIVAGLSLIATVPRPWALYLGVAIFACGIAIQFPALMGLALRGAADHERAGVVGTYTAFQDLSQGLSGLLLGVATYFAGYRASFGGGAVLALCGLALLMFTYRPGRPGQRMAVAPADISGDAVVSGNA
jgi:predicted MFS family arabinose efflux permease